MHTRKLGEKQKIKVKKEGNIAKCTMDEQTGQLKTTFEAQTMWV